MLVSTIPLLQLLMTHSKTPRTQREYWPQPTLIMHVSNASGKNMPGAIHGVASGEPMYLDIEFHQSTSDQTTQGITDAIWHQSNVNTDIPCAIISYPFDGTR